MSEKDKTKVVDDTTPITVDDAPLAGAFIDSLKRNYSKIRSDRAQAIGEDVQLVYRRKVEDLALKIKRKFRDQEALLDLSPTTTTTLVPNLSDFDADQFVEKDMKLGLELRNLQIKYTVALKRYEHLFGDFKKV